MGGSFYVAATSSSAEKPTIFLMPPRTPHNALDLGPDDGVDSGS
jgi:hypothetical protein